MLNKYVHLSFFFFLLVALTGIWMRLVPFHSFAPFPYDHVLHAHSHVAMLGFQFLAILVIFLTLVWKKLDPKKKRQAISICFTLTVITIFMFLAFLYQGYAVLSIVMSALHIFAEYWAAIFIFRETRSNYEILNFSRIYIYGSLIALFTSSLGPYALGFISANNLKETALFDAALYFYLHFQYNGWLTFVTLGLFFLILAKRKININQSLANRGFWIYFISLFPSFFSNILWIDELGIYAEMISTIGIFGQWFAIITIARAMRHSWRDIKSNYSKWIVMLISLTLFLLLIKSTMELGLMIPGLADLVYTTRNVIIGYLHLTLLGFISIFILTQFFMLGILQINRIAKNGLTLFLIGFILNELLLFWDGLASWTGFGKIAFTVEGLLVASGFLGVGIVLLWFSVRKRQLDC